MLEQPFADIDDDDVQSRATNAIVRSRMEEARWQQQRQEHIIQTNDTRPARDDCDGVVVSPHLARTPANRHIHHHHHHHQGPDEQDTTLAMYQWLQQQNSTRQQHLLT
jgi:hypothetical protein